MAAPEPPEARATLLVAMAGGHLTQLHQLLPRLPVDLHQSTWVTVRTAQSESLLRGQDVVWVPYSKTRDLLTATTYLRSALRVTRRPYELAISTGSSIALPFLAVARARGVSTHYIESATRVNGPSLTGRLLCFIPGVHLYTQHVRWAGHRWRHQDGILEEFSAEHVTPPSTVRKAVVSVGSAVNFPFPELVAAAVRVLPTDCQVLWQVGILEPSCSPPGSRVSVPGDELQAAVAEADVVICHAGTGSALTALRLGKCPVLVPRVAGAGQHVDDHQQEIAAELVDRGLAVVARPDELSWRHVEQALSTKIVSHGATPIVLA